jgi:poly(3-hydroxybutyrate) depolymerase
MADRLGIAAVRLLIFALLVGVLQSAALAESELQKGRVLTRSYDFKEAGKQMEYALFVPTRYQAKKPAPLVILLHGLNSNPLQVIGYQGITEQAEKYGFIVAAPFGYNTGGWYGSRGAGKDWGPRLPPAAADAPDNLGELSEKDVLNVLESMRQEFNVDAKRIYLMGHSMGGGGSFYLGMKHPEIWAALAPMSPAIYSDPDELKSILEMPVIVVQGEKDTLVPVASARAWVAKMQELGMKHKYIEIPGGNHIQSITQNPAMIAEVFAFLNKHKRR